MQRLYTPEEVAEMLNISLSMVYKLVRNKEIDHIRIGRSVRFTEQAINEYLFDNSVEAICTASNLRKPLGA